MPSCRHCSQAYEVTKEDGAFLGKIAPTFAGVRYEIPPPTLCPDCRRQRRLSWRNERHLHHRPSDLTGKWMISMYAPEAPYVVYEHDEWFHDSWDATEYGLPYDDSRSFFEQYSTLLKRCPLINVLVSESENCSYMNHGWRNKNCYLACDIGNSEDVYYSQTMYDCRSAVDCMYCRNGCERCYECSDSEGCYGSAFLSECRQCTDCRFCFDCRGCSDCAFSWNLRNKKHCIANVQYSPEDYAKKTAELRSGSQKKLLLAQSEFEALIVKNAIRHPTSNVNAEQCVGAFLTDCKDCRFCFHCSGVESGAYLHDGASPGGRDYQDDDRSGWGAELSYETMGTPGPYRCMGVISCGEPVETYYSYFCHSPKQCFGCVGLKQKSFCILNKQYTKEEYEVLVPKIIQRMMSDGEWGEFFPTRLSPFAYNESLAPDFFPLDAKDVEQRGWQWRTTVDETPKVSRVIAAADLPDLIDDIPDDVPEWAITCEGSGRLFKILRQELEFYRSMRLPLPRIHPDERHRRRMARRNPRKLWARPCGKCGTEMRTSYAPERPETVYCEKCYLETVY